MEEQEKEAALKRIREKALKSDKGNLISVIYYGDKKVCPETEKNTEETKDIFKRLGIQKI